MGVVLQIKNLYVLALHTAKSAKKASPFTLKTV